MIDIQNPEFQIYGECNEDGYIDVVITVLEKQSASMIAKFNKAHRKRTGIKGLGKIPEHLAKKLEKKGKVSQKVADKLYAQIEGLYDILFSAYANAKIIESFDRKVIFTDGHEVCNLGNNIWQIQCKVWLEPEVKVLVDDFDWKFNIDDMTVDTYVQDRIQSFAKLNPYLHLKEDKSEVNDMVELAVDAIADGSIIESMCEEATNIRVLKDAVHPKQLYDKLSEGVSAGDEFTIVIDDSNDFPPNYYKDLIDKKQLELTVRVIRVYTCEDPKIDDDLAITAGYESLDEWTKALTDSGNRNINTARERIRNIAVVDYLLSVTKCDDLPDSWAKLKAKELQLPETSDSYDKLKNLFKHTILLKHVGEMYGIGWDDVDQSIYDRDEHAYAGKVLRYLVKMSEFENVISQAVEDDRGDRNSSNPGQSS